MSVYQVVGSTFPLHKSCRLASLTLRTRPTNGRVVCEGLLHGDGGDQVAEEPVRRTEGGCRPPLHPRPTGTHFQFNNLPNFLFLYQCSTSVLGPERFTTDPTFHSLQSRIKAETEPKPSQVNKS
jgi:hypothetical protein